MRSRKTKLPPKSIGRAAVNLAGLSSAFAIAFGGLFLVQDRLSREQKKLLTAGGSMALPQSESAEAGAADISLRDALTEEKLLQLVRSLEQREDISPHEPLEGQLTMVQAIECCEAWLTEFFLSDFAPENLSSSEYRINSYLWAPEGSDPEASPWLSCWTISLINQNIDASLTLSAVSGQVLDVSVSCSLPAENQSRERLLTLFDKYALSFGLEEGDFLLSFEDKETETNKLFYCQSIGSRELYAAIQTGNIIYTASGTNPDIAFYRELFNVRLYLSSGPQHNPSFD